MADERGNKTVRSEAGKGGHPSEWPLRLSPAQVLLLVALLVFTAEAAIMLILPAAGPLLPWQEALVDAGALLLFLSPLYFIVYRPLRRQYLAHLRAGREIRRLSRETLRARERERSLFVKDLHEECGQLLMALQLGIDMLCHTAPADREDLLGQCRKLQDYVATLGTHVRTLSARLRPALLETCGIVPALEREMEVLGEQGATVLELQSEGSLERLDPELEIALFRICQEGLANVLRHARANHASVCIARGPGEIRLRVEDDGAGFDPAAPTSGLGLIGMRERVAAFGGTLEIDTVPGRGTVLYAVFPLLEPAA